VSGAYVGSAGGPDWGPLERAIAGEVAVLGWPAFDRVPRPFDARYHDPLPRTVVLCAAPADVAETLAFLGAHSLEPAIRSDGHCFAGHSSTSGVIVDVSAMRAVSIDGDLDDRSGATPFAASMASRSKKDRSAYRGDVAAESRSLSIPQRPGTSSMATCASQITRGDPEESGRHARPQAYTDDRDSRFEDPDGWKSSSALDFESAAEPMEKMNSAGRHRAMAQRLTLSGNLLHPQAPHELTEPPGWGSSWKCSPRRGLHVDPASTVLRVSGPSRGTLSPDADRATGDPWMITALPAGLPIPADDGAAAHVAGRAVPRIALLTTGGYDDGARRCRAERTAGGVRISEDWTPG
jgi:hypothetical protein